MDFMKDAGLDVRFEGSQPSFGAQKVDAFGEMRKASSGPRELRVGSRVRHVHTGRRGMVKYVGYADGRTVAVDWDDESLGLYSANELTAEF